ncbi:hypothetical protein [Prosthecobacter sp.]|uniref:hypothetical protein n=1 Tax=Prosthecobacter sp. TaxID=1965333 RepID=UPI0025F33890|nr:hypothetical protein [Prosthecobacter sp.]
MRPVNGMVSFLISAGTLWFLLVLFHEGSNFEAQEQQALTIILVVSFVGWAANMLLPDGFWPVALLLQVVTLYLAVDKFCGYSTRTTWKIVISFFGAHLILSMIVVHFVF